MITIKEYASQRGVSAQSVHQKIKRNQKELGEHIHVEKGVKYLDDVAINILEGTTEHQKSQKQAKQTLISPDVKKELDELREENARLKSDLIKKQDEMELAKFDYVILLLRLKHNREVRVVKLVVVNNKIEVEEERITFLNEIYQIEMPEKIQETTRKLLLD